MICSLKVENFYGPEAQTYKKKKKKKMVRFSGLTHEWINLQRSYFSLLQFCWMQMKNAATIDLTRFVQVRPNWLLVLLKANNLMPGNCVELCIRPHDSTI